MIYYIGALSASYGDLQHYGIKGMRWGIRRWQNEDGSYTEEGKRRYSGSSDNPKRLDNKQSHSGDSGHSDRSSSDFASKVNGNKEGKNETKQPFWTDKRKDTAKKVAIAAGIATAAALAYYGVGKVGVVEAEAGLNWYTSRYATKLASTPLSKLKDDDIVVQAGQKMQRIIRDYNDTGKAISIDSAKDFIYATTNERDNKTYRAIFNSLGEGKKVITERTIVKDLVMPSQRKRVQAFMDLMKDKSFADALSEDLNTIGRGYQLKNHGRIRKFSSEMLFSPALSDTERQKLYSTFFGFAGNSSSKSARIYFDKIRNLGYTAISDDNDGGYISKAPLILLNASNDTVVSGKRYASMLDEIMSRATMKHLVGLKSF